MSDIMLWVIGVLTALIASPLLCGIINKVKAFFAGRRGPRLLQLYYDLGKLLQKDPVRSRTAGMLFRLGPVIGLTTAVGSLLIMPQGGAGSPFAFTGDLILFLYLAGTGRLFTVLAALETGSSFEGMGSARECEFAIFTEAAFLAIFGAFVLMTGGLSLSLSLVWNSPVQGAVELTGVVLMLLSLFIVILAECCRVPVDDPETHLELTMIHEAMILDHSGSDLALIHYAAFLKMWVLFSFWMLILLPHMDPVLMLILQFIGVLICAAAVGTVESVMARCRFLKVPQLLGGAAILSILAVILLLF